MGISNTQYRDIIFQYDQRRMKNQRLLNKRYDMLYQKYPELKEIHDKIIELSMEQAANEVLTPGQAAEKRVKMPTTLPIMGPRMTMGFMST